MCLLHHLLFSTIATVSTHVMHRYCMVLFLFFFFFCVFFFFFFFFFLGGGGGGGGVRGACSLFFCASEIFCVQRVQVVHALWPDVRLFAYISDPLNMISCREGTTRTLG